MLRARCYSITSSPKRVLVIGWLPDPMPPPDSAY